MRWWILFLNAHGLRAVIANEGCEQATRGLISVRLYCLPVRAMDKSLQGAISHSCMNRPSTRTTSTTEKCIPAEHPASRQPINISLLYSFGSDVPSARVTMHTSLHLASDRSGMRASAVGNFGGTATTAHPHLTSAGGGCWILCGAGCSEGGHTEIRLK